MLIVLNEVMDPQPKRHKKNLPENCFHPFPIDNIGLESNHKFSGYFTGLNVEIFDGDDIKMIYENGSFGIGSVTQAAPKVLWTGNVAPTKVPKEIFDKKCEWRQQIGASDKRICIEIVTKSKDVDSDDTKIVLNKPIREDPFHIEETLVLTLEESFFLHYILKCLRVMDVSGTELQTNDILLKFCNLKRHFWTHFVAYLYLRSKNWIVKCGLKFGGDFREFDCLTQIYVYSDRNVEFQCSTKKDQDIIMQVILYSFGTQIQRNIHR